MAREAPPHGHVGRFPGDRHFVHPPMTARAADSLVNVDGVIEINVARHFIHRVPFNGLVFRVTLPNGLEHGPVLPNLGVAGHACLGVRHARIRRRGHGSVAKAAVDPKFARVVLMAEGNRLIQCHAHVGPIGRAIKQIKGVRSSHQEYPDADDENFGIEIDAGWKKLSHGSVRALLPPNFGQRTLISNFFSSHLSAFRSVSVNWRVPPEVGFSLERSMTWTPKSASRDFLPSQFATGRGIGAVGPVQTGGHRPPLQKTRSSAIAVRISGR